MIPEITDAGRPITSVDICAVEHRFGCVLPAPYVRFLRRHNGGTPWPDAFHGKRPEDEALVHFFYSIDGDEHTDLVTEAGIFRGYHDVPECLLPIARTPSGDIVCIGITPANHGEVWFWSHDHPVREQATWKLADDLDSFLATFHAVEL